MIVDYSRHFALLVQDYFTSTARQAVFVEETPMTFIALELLLEHLSASSFF